MCEPCGNCSIDTRFACPIPTSRSSSGGRLAAAVGLPPPLSKQMVNGFEVDFQWPDLGLVVETDGLRYHRTPSAQARDRLRDQTHVAAGLTVLRFTHRQVKYEPDHVCSVLGRTAQRLAG